MRESRPFYGDEKIMNIKMSNKTYDVMKIIALIVLPAIGTLLASLSDVWCIPHGQQISATIFAVNTCLGTILGISNAQYTRSLRKKNLQDK